MSNYDEWGVFNEDGLLDGPFFSREEAQQAADVYPIDEGATVEKLCSDHNDQPDVSCEYCSCEDDGEEE